MVILGIDTAIRRTGYGVVRMEGNRIHVLDCGVIKNAPSLKHSECVRRIYMGIKELVDAFKPDAASIEMAFVGKNVRTTMILSMARGAAIASASNAGVPVYEYSPKTAKRSAVGMGTASKEQVCHLEVSGIPNDSTDALALAVCHGNIAVRPELAAFLAEPL